ncbi:MAG: glutathione S-transferase family protein [Thalassobaculum sp.]|uniref:glutathione S-transferase family protein n=1 Tax=Thalassobaculum sp. TaxID=2022740 RepID=UPI0032EEAA1A
MTEFTLVIGNKNYSSWSLRPWLSLRHAGIEFDEILIPLDDSRTKAEILKHSGSGRLPALKHGDLTVWDSLAICEYAAELRPEAGLWPDDRGARAVARSLSAEMHTGFAALRSNMPMNIRSRFPEEGRKPGVKEDIDRITALWRQTRSRFGADGPFLFGRFTIADAMFAPVVSRFRTYAVALGDVEQAYADAVWGLAAMKEWAKAADDEPMVIDSSEF